MNATLVKSEQYRGSSVAHKVSFQEVQEMLMHGSICDSQVLSLNTSDVHAIDICALQHEIDSYTI